MVVRPTAEKRTLKICGAVPTSELFWRANAFRFSVRRSQRRSRDDLVSDAGRIRIESAHRSNARGTGTRTRYWALGVMPSTRRLRSSSFLLTETRDSYSFRFHSFRCLSSNGSTIVLLVLSFPQSLHCQFNMELYTVLVSFVHIFHRTI